MKTSPTSAPVQQPELVSLDHRETEANLPQRILPSSPRARPQSRRQRLVMATPMERELIYQLRHAVYARELGQHQENTTGRLSDSLDNFNHYLCLWEDSKPSPRHPVEQASPASGSSGATTSLAPDRHEFLQCIPPEGSTLLGFISITPPSAGAYSIDKYLDLESVPFECDNQLYEVRLLTVIEGSRGRAAAGLLMYAALRWIESRGGTRIMAIGRKEILPLYEKAGLKRTGREFQSGKVAYELMHAAVRELCDHAARNAHILDRFKAITDWQLDIPFHHPPPCFHGGTFFQAIGERFDELERADKIINADVLDAWFPPAPQVIEAVTKRLPWLLRTSPPTSASGLVQAVSDARRVPDSNILPGAGSSDLIFRALPRWLRPDSRVLILDPTYGEYSHILERVIGCHVDRFELREIDSFEIDSARLGEVLFNNYDLVVIVNPNSPTGRYLNQESLRNLLLHAPRRTRFWIDETYIEYVGAEHSMERFAATSENVVVCKTMSKVYALSGARVAYLCGPRHLLEPLIGFTPPWVVSLPAQVAAVSALKQTEYYEERYAETHRLRSHLANELTELGLKVFPGQANFLLVRLPVTSPGAAALSSACQEHGLFIRNASSMSNRFGDRFIRIAVKDSATNNRMLGILRGVLNRIEELHPQFPANGSASTIPSSNQGVLS
jgi:histidinol-phosphate/aromatic aminotransferase/cobyric acid decarboxylase-like protein